jgi:dihydroflavonol-4-reductase
VIAAMAETVLVTGGTGFIAGWCIVELLRRGYRVRTTVRDRSKEARVHAAVAGTGINAKVEVDADAPVGTGATVNADALTFFHADLTQDAGWDAAAADCDYILHVASPLGGGANDRIEALTAAARDGTLRVLKAAVKANVKRVVMTSAAATARPPLDSDRTSDETVWSDPDDTQFDAYRRSKILAERAAWELMSTSGRTTEFTTILPGAVFGPILSADNPGSVRIIQGLLKGEPKALPQLGFWIVDVRDLADLHIRAMIAPAAAGERFIAANEFMWMRDVANTLRAQLGPAAAKVSTRQLPNWLVKMLLPVLPNLKGLAPLLGRRFALSSQKARQVLAFAPRPAAATIIDCARSLMTNKV